MEMTPATRDSNNHDLDLQRQAKRDTEKLIKKQGLEKASNEYIGCLIYHKLWNSDRCWKTPAEVQKGVKALIYKKDKEEVLKDNLQMRFKRFGWEEEHSTWSENGRKKPIPVLQAKLIEVIQ